MAVPLIHAFRREMPEASVSITEGLSTAMHESLVSGRLDIALLYNASASPDIELTPLLEEDLYLVEARPAPAGKRAVKGLQLKDLAQTPLVIPSRPNAIRMQVETELARQGLRPMIAMEIDGVAAILELVADGAGSAVLSSNAVHTSGRPQAFSMRPIGEPPLRSRLSMAMSSQRPTTLTQQATLDLLRQTAARVLQA